MSSASRTRTIRSKAQASARNGGLLSSFGLQDFADRHLSTHLPRAIAHLHRPDPSCTIFSTLPPPTGGAGGKIQRHFPVAKASIGMALDAR